LFSSHVFWLKVCKSKNYALHYSLLRVTIQLPYM